MTIETVTGLVNVKQLAPAEGDAIVVVNCGTHYEIRYYQLVQPGLELTEEDIQNLMAGRVTFN